MENADFIEGDMRGDATSIDQLRNAVIDPRLRWPNAVIPYVISTSFSKSIVGALVRYLKEHSLPKMMQQVPRRGA